MRISELLYAMASWLESPNNEALLLAEYDADCLKIVAESCVAAAKTLKAAAEQVDTVEPEPESNITSESIQGLAEIASAFDSSGDVELKKQASVIDELLLTIAAMPSAFAERKDLLENRVTELKKKYQQPREELHKTNRIAETEKGINKSNMTKNFRILEAPLSSRYCPDHPGAQIARVGEHMWQCELDKKTYNFETGFELNTGEKVPGGDVSQQTQGLDTPTHAIFDSREGRLATNKV